MGFVCSGIFFIIAYLGLVWNGKRKVYSPLFLFALFWGILCFLSDLHLYRLFETSIFAYLCILTGVAGFSIGCILVGFSKKVKCSPAQKLNLTVYNVLLLVCVAALYLNFSLIISFIKGGLDISYIYYVMAADPTGESGELSGMFNENLVKLQQFIGYPLLYTLVPISIVEYIETKKKYYLFVAIFLSLIRFLVDIRRTYIVIIVLFVIVLLLLRRSKYKRMNIRLPKMTIKTKVLTALFLGVVTILFSMLSQARISEDDLDKKDNYSVFSNFYFYYVGSLPYFSQRLELDKGNEMTYGFTSFRGIASPIVGGLKMLGMEDLAVMKTANDNVNSLHAVTLNITPTHNSNSYATLFFEFYLDGGLLGVFLISFLFGIYSQQLFVKAYRFQTNRYSWKYAFYVSLFLFLSVLHFNGVVVCYIWPFIIERLFYTQLPHTNLKVTN